jgi:hypothetical protein
MATETPSSGPEGDDVRDQPPSSELPSSEPPDDDPARGMELEAQWGWQVWGPTPGVEDDPTEGLELDPEWRKSGDDQPRDGDT